MNRWWLLGPLLGGAVLLSLLGDPSTRQAALVPTPLKDRVAAAPVILEPASRPPDASAAPRGLIARDQLYPSIDRKASGNDLFGRRDWAPPAPRVSAPKPVVDPTPPFPYAYAGRRQDGDKAEVYLTRDDLAYLVRPGETLDGTYRIESITSTELVVVHLPSSHRHHIRIGNAD